MSVAAVIQMTSSPRRGGESRQPRADCWNARARKARCSRRCRRISRSWAARKRTSSRSRKRWARARSRRSWATARASSGCGSSAARSRSASRQSPGASLPPALVFDERGRCVARYDKIHLFDVDIPGREERYRESATIAPGAQPVVVDDTARPARPGRVLRRALSRAVPRAAGAGRGSSEPAFGIHRTDGTCALGAAVARARSRESVLRAGAGAERHARQRARNLRRFA